MMAATGITGTCLAFAEEALRAAQAIAAEPSCAPRSAAAPLAAALQALACAWAPERPAALTGEPATWLPTDLWARMSPRERRILRRELPLVLAEARRGPEAPISFPLTRRQVLAHVARIERWIASSRGTARSGGDAWWRLSRMIAAVAGLAVLVARPWQTPDLGPWRGAYYSLPDFKGEVVVRRDLDLRFDWGKRPPFDEIPANKYSVRWDTCLHLDAPRRVAFQLTTDNSAQLHVDGRIVLKNWGAKELRARGEVVTLAAGVHHLRVDYKKTNAESHIGLTASLDDEPPTSLPFARLSAPDDAGGHVACE